MKHKIIIFTGPSGVGKSKVEEKLLIDKELKISFSISVTTRKPRIGEKNGESYHFVTKKKFNELIEKDDLIEWSEHFSNKYGTLKSEINKIGKEGKIPLLEIDINGAISIINNKKTSKKFEIISIFLMPPSKEELLNRLIKRGTETKEQILERSDRVNEELEKAIEFKHIVINDKVENAYKKIKEILMR
ncbi:MAG: guanylate kinase [Mollicutes bacterium PWAP]|nr:guanylate kinase [Mollicutes bacterium PWAP]